MNTKLNRLFECASLARRPIFITSCVAALAAATIAGGCNTSPSQKVWGRGHKTPADLNAEQKAALATESIDPHATAGRYDKGWYEAQARDVKLPDVWVSEAKGATADIEARRAAAQAARVQRNATASDMSWATMT